MRIYPDCFPCFFRQASIAFHHADIKDSLRFDIFNRISQEISRHELSVSPAHITSHIHRLIRKEIGFDPFAAVKREYNARAGSLYKDLKETIVSSDDPLLTASRLAIAGNIIDFGIYTSVNIEKTIEKALKCDLAVDDYTIFRSELDKAGEVLYLLDNAGEIIFDKLLIETIIDNGVSVTAVVKGGPVINDATITDVEETGLGKICMIRDNGSDAVGTILKLCSDDFVEEFERDRLIISKGQANFETLMNEKGKNIYYLFQAKCDVLADHLGVPTGSMIFSKGTTHWRSKV